MATSHDERIQKLQKQLEQAKAAKRKADARQKAQESKKARAEDTRRKVLLGAMLQLEMERSEQTRMQTLARLDVFLTRQADRDLFNLGQPKTEPTFLSDDHDDGAEPPAHFRS